jgi:hypothetical protein
VRGAGVADAQAEQQASVSRRRPAAMSAAAGRQVLFTPVATVTVWVQTGT